MIELKLPWPPSTNKAWVPTGRAKGKGFRLNPKANFFRLAVKSIVLAAKIKGLPLADNLEVHITLCPPDRRKRDQDNFAGKALLDALTKANVWRDDSQIRRTVIEWGDVQRSGAVVVRISRMGRGVENSTALRAETECGPSRAVSE